MTVSERNTISNGAHDQSGKYPGEAATAEDILCLAEEFLRSAEELVQRGRKGKHLSYAPARFVAIHAIELFLNAYLQHFSHTHEEIRALNHDLKKRHALASEHGLKLRKKTADHIAGLSVNREYIVTRYGPEMTPILTQINRLTATMNEVAKKVAAVIRK